MINKLTDKLKTINMDAYVIRALSAWCMTAFVFQFTHGGNFSNLANYSNVSFTSLIICFLLFFGTFSLGGYLSAKKKNRFNKVMLPACFAIFSLFTLLGTTSFFFAFVLIAFWAILIYYYQSHGMLSLANKTSSVKKWVSVAIIIAVFSVIAITSSVLKYKTYSAPNFDFGIFCHMFRNMKESFRPVTTCERDTLLSHFAVHASLIYYVLLPIYYIFPSPSTLQVCQALVLASSAIPLVLIAKKYNLSNTKTVFLTAAFMFHPAIISGTNYDIHENCFLLPLLLWVFWAFETDRLPALIIFTFLTLSVKEDAAVYIIFFAIYIFFARRKMSKAFILAVIAVGYFCTVLYLLKTYGNGVMSDRYKNYLPNGGSLTDVVKNILADPGYVFTQLLVDKNGTYIEKILFILQMFVPFAFLPFATKKVSNLLLLLPLMLMNLMTVYLYQYDIGFQYHFGVMAFLAYLSIINLSTMKNDSAKTAISIALTASLCLFMMTGVSRFSAMTSRWSEYKENYKVMDEALAEIPEDASVICSTFLLPHLCDRDEIYEDFYHDNSVLTDYVILDARNGDYSKEKFDLYSELGYETEKEVENNGEKLLIIMTREGA